MKTRILTLAILASLSVPAFASAGELPAVAPAPTFDCGGTEPFWDLAISPKAIRFSLPIGESQPIDLAPVAPQSARGTQEDWLRVYRTQDATGKPVQIVVRKNDQCSDSMSEQTYGYEVIVTLDDVYYGCCNLAK